MSKNNILSRAFLDALGVLAYITLFVWFVNNIEKWFGPMHSQWLGGIFFLTMFIVSASVTGSLVLLKPILLYAEGEKRVAVNLFFYTIVFLAVMAVVVGISILSLNKPVPAIVNPEHCGGNMANAPMCGVGYHCAPAPGSKLPFGDVGGICVVD